MKLTKEQIKQAIREAIDPKQWADIVTKLKRMPVADRDIAMQKMLSFFSRVAPSNVGAEFVKQFRNPTDVIRGQGQGMPDLAPIARGEDPTEPELKPGGIIPARMPTPHAPADRLHGIPKPPQRGAPKAKMPPEGGDWKKTDPSSDVARQAFGLDKDTGAGVGPSLASLAKQAMEPEAPKSVGPKPDTLRKPGKLAKLGKKVASKFGGKKKVAKEK